MKSVFSILNPRYHTAEEKIDIPNRIQRGPTDILRALESTVKTDLTAAHYKYHDDPFLIPMSNVGKRTFAMAQESGRKAAHWVRAQHPELFQHNAADPPIQMFFPKIVYNKDGDISEDNLKAAIKAVLVNDAIEIYKLCKEKGVEISPETMISFLEALCYNNGDEPLPEEFIEERWFRQSTKGKEKKRKTWKDGALAEEIFISINNPDEIAYSALIQGMSKYYQSDRAWQLFQEAQEKGIALNIETYNSLIRVSNFLKENYDLRWTFIVDLLTLAAKAKLKPNLRTLNAVLESLSLMGTSKNTKNLTLQTLSEFKKIGVEPALSSWYYVLNTFCKERGPVSWVLEDILVEIENKEHKIQDLIDTFFFVTAMDVCRNHLHDKELAKRVNKLLHHGSNYDLIGDSFKESIYYRHYFILLCQTEPLDTFMEEIYFKLVPHIYVPEPSVMGEILDSIEINTAIEYVPRIWSDMTIFDHTDREKLISSILNIMVNNHPEDKPDLVEKFGIIAWDIFTKIENQNEHRTQPVMFTGVMLGNILTLLLRNQDFEKATEIVEKLDADHQKVVGVPGIEPLKMYLDYCIRENAPSKAIVCIQYCAESGFQEAENMAKRLHSEMTLDETHLEKLSKIVGNFFIEQSLKKNENTT
ncbi:pentatricopeptide repeat domain-containing protein 3 [Holotrichia oblita]|uniref:Pentatricopeptide repeat domain-containing protein 3 n=1 Tax=Holotrichia oblita TaxID=644536 RepID=A0ACB9SWI0_HOLOL|nr:pentatricopeptide repeat domain-containing protein 3 [Holotrichia oblita]